MRKKDLLNIPLPDVPEELVSIAQQDEYRTRNYKIWGKVYKEKSYGTKMYFSADNAEGWLIVQMWGRADLARGKYEPISVTYINVAEKQWNTRLDGKWSKALLENIYGQYEHQPKTFWKAKNISTQEQTDLCNEIFDTDEVNVYESVCEWQGKVRKDICRGKAERRKAKWQRMMDLLPEIPEDFKEWAEGEGTINDNFLFYRRIGGKYETYCTRCGTKSYTTQKMQHNKGHKDHWSYKGDYRGWCDTCKRFYDTKAWGRQKATLTESRVVLPQIAGEYISMRQFSVRKLFELKEDPLSRETNWSIKTHIVEEDRIFADRETFESVDSFREEYVQQLDETCWRRVKGRDYMGTPYFYQISQGQLYMRNADEIRAASGLPLTLYKRCGGGPGISPQRMLILMAKARYVEYLEKAGLKNIANEVLKYGRKVENPHADNLKDLLGVDGQMLRTLKDIDGHIEMIKVLKEIQHRKEKVNLETLKIINLNELRITDLQTKKTGLTIQRAMNYLVKQSEKEGRPLRGIVAEYDDYLKIAEELGNNPRDEIINRTPDLKGMHDRYVEERNRIKDAEREISANKTFTNITASSAKNIEHFKYKKDGMMILVPTKASEIIEEGRKQHHCVGANETYIKRMDEGISYILFLRKEKEPEKPYYTLEVNWNGSCRQSYGAYDRRPDGEMIDEWLRYFSRAIGKRTEREKQREAGKETKRILVAAG